MDSQNANDVTGSKLNCIGLAKVFSHYESKMPTAGPGHWQAMGKFSMRKRGQ